MAWKYIKNNSTIIVPLITSVLALIGAIFTAWYVGTKSFEASIVSANKNIEASIKTAMLNNEALLKSTDMSNRNLLESTRLLIESNLEISKEGISSTARQIQLENELETSLEKDRENIKSETNKRISVAFLHAFISTIINLSEAQLGMIGDVRKLKLLKKNNSVFYKEAKLALDQEFIKGIVQYFIDIDIELINQHAKNLTPKNSTKVITYFVLIDLLKNQYDRSLEQQENAYTQIEKYMSSLLKQENELGEILIKQTFRNNKLVLKGLESQLHSIIIGGLNILIELNRYLGISNDELMRKLKTYERQKEKYEVITDGDMIKNIHEFQADVEELEKKQININE